MGRHREFPVENDHTITPPSGLLPREIRLQFRPLCLRLHGDDYFWSV